MFALVFAAAIRLTHFSAVAASTIPEWHKVELESDYAATWTWASEIRAGNLLGQPTFHPYTGWMRALGTKADWARWWGGEEIFQQAPLYPYLVALIDNPPVGSPLPVLLFQILFGLLALPCVAELARRWHGELAASVAAWGWTLSQGAVALDAFLVRDSLGISLAAISLWAVERIDPWSKPVRKSVIAGALLGLAALDRENMLALGAVAPLIVFWKLRPTPRVRGRASAACLASLLLVLSPVCFRNVIVGAPLLSLSNRPPEAIAEGFSTDADADPVGFQVPSNMGEVLEHAHGSSWRVMVELLHRAPDAGSVISLLGRKLWALLSPYEPADNVDLNYLCWISPVLRPLIPGCVFMWFGLLGLALCLRRPDELPLAWASSTVLLLPLLFTSTLWRIRAGLLPVFVPLSGVAVAWLVQRWRSREGVPFSSAVAVGVLGALALSYAFPPKPLFRVRYLEVVSSARVHLRRGEPKRALEEVDAWLGLVSRGRASRARASAMRAFRDRIAALPGPSAPPPAP